MKKLHVLMCKLMCNAMKVMHAACTHTKGAAKILIGTAHTANAIGQQQCVFVHARHGEVQEHITRSSLEDEGNVCHTTCVRGSRGGMCRH